MKVSCTQENLAKGLGIVGRSVGNRSTLPVLNNILLQTEKGRLKISATDLEVGIHTWIGSKVDADGAITIPAKLLMDYVNTNKDKTITLELKESTLQLQSEHYKANIKGIEASEFPLIPEVKNAAEIEVLVSDFSTAISRTIIATALDESRPVLAGIYLNANDNKLKMVATDSYRLAEQTISLSKKITQELSVIVPQRTMAEVGRILGENIEKAKILIGENQIEFILGETILVSRLIEGNFPDYTQIIPKSHKTRLEASTAEFANAIKMASLFARESANNIKVKMDPANETDKIQVLAVSPQLGDNVSAVAGKVEGEALEIAFNAKFVLDALQVLGSENLALELSGNLTAGILKSIKDPNYLYVIMPLRIDE